ncbi:MAG TPA: hypothetical protein VGO92_01235, partial [Acidimicrobiales bacterium]|nr:hypothetical protein [Acidimicrobiales bacterium]
MGVEEQTWDPPGPGMWFFSPEHIPRPGCTLLVELLPWAATGWRAGTERYGLPPNLAAFGASNRWFFYAPGPPAELTAAELAELDGRAAEAMATRRWRTELRRWRDDVRPRLVARHRALLAVDLSSL